MSSCNNIMNGEQIPLTGIRSSSLMDERIRKYVLNDDNDIEEQFQRDNDELVCISSDSNHPQHEAAIGWVGSISLFINEITGPGMLVLPATYQRCGFIPTSAVIILIAAVSSLCGLNMANVISLVPGNKSFSKDIEYSAAFRYFVGREAFYFTEVLFSLAILSQIIASIVDTAQVFDTFMGSPYSGDVSSSIGIRLIPAPIRLISWNSEEACDDSTRDDATTCSPFDETIDGEIFLTFGYIISAAIFIPISMLNLEDNIIWQICSFFALLVCCAQFLLSFILNGLDFSNLSLWGNESPQSGDLIGVVLFNFGIVTAIPSWLYEKCPKVSVEQTVHFSCGFSAFLYILVGTLGALAIKNVPQNLLTALTAGVLGPVTSVFSSFFCFFVIGFGIPLFSVLMRLNVVRTGLCSERMGKHLTITFPWVVSFLFYRGDVVEQLLSWGGILTALIVFVGPLALALLVSFSTSEVNKGAILHVRLWGDSKIAERIELVSISVFTAVLVFIGVMRS